MVAGLLITANQLVTSRRSVRSVFRAVRALVFLSSTVSVRCQEKSSYTMASNTQGIQQLLAAEKKAADKVGEARKRKARRLKQAKDEATEEIEKYRAERDRTFKEFEAKHVGSREGVSNKIDADTRARIDEMNRALGTQKEPVIQDVLSFVYAIKTEVHKNYRQ